MNDTRKNFVFDLIFVLVLVAAATLRLTGINWDEDQHLHPDERFLTSVEAGLAPVDSLGAYFDTATSSLNPNNRGAGFFVYGTLPVFIVRYAAEWVGQTGYDQIQLVGRAASAVADLGVVLLAYLIAAKLFDRRVALLAALFAAFSVKSIQESHFFTVDNFTTLMAYLTLFFALRVAIGPRRRKKVSEEGEEPLEAVFNIWDFVGFGLALGMAVASKVSVVVSLLPLPAVLPVAMAIRLGSVGAEQRRSSWGRGLVYLGGAAFLSLLAFRIFQPYAFAGPGFLSGLNPMWIDTMTQLQGQVTGNVDWPPSMQWARRPIWFGLQNMVQWGLGLPLGLVALVGFLWAGWRVVKGDWQKPFALLWLWATGVLLWLSFSFNPTMRYFLPVYPTFAIFGAWGLVALWDSEARPKWTRPAAGLLAAVAVLGGAAWTLAFVQIYRQPVSRLAATRWIFQNVPGPVTLELQTADGVYHQPLGFPYNGLLQNGAPYPLAFSSKADGQIDEVDLAHVLAPLHLYLSTNVDGEVILADQPVVTDLLDAAPGESIAVDFDLGTPLADPGPEYKLSIGLPPGQGDLRLERVELRTDQPTDQPSQSLLDEAVSLSMGEHYDLSFFLPEGYPADQIHLEFQVETPLQLAPVDMRLTVTSDPEGNQVLAEAQAEVQPSTSKGGLVAPTIFSLSQPVAASESQVLYLRFEMLSPGELSLLGSAVANESSWDDGLPRRMDGYDAFGGIYQGDLNFEMYWDANADKQERFLNILDNAEYIFISSSRQWGSLPRIPERFPLVTAYYRELLGCPESRSIEWCYDVADVGRFEGSLGFDLVQVFTNAPHLGGLVINDQPVEEAFTVYDHPKVFIFKKNADYDHTAMVNFLSGIDLSNVQHVTPKEASGRVPPNLMLPADRLAVQRAGGTWSQIFNTDSWINAAPWVSAIVWYLALMLLGVAVYPLVRMALPGLKDGGYPFARLAGLLLLAYLGWLGASLGLSFTRGWLAFFALLLIALGALAAWYRLDSLKQEWRERRGQFLRIEVLFLAFFLLMLFIRLGNPDLWHPSFGGEKPMDFAYFNAVLKSTTFPPYDPWFAGGYINYYYFGFVLVGAFTKLLGIVPAVAYNLFLPSLFAMLALGAFSLAWNLFSAWREHAGRTDGASPTLAGLAAAAAMVLLGNLGSIGMIFMGYLRLGAAGAAIEGAGLFTKLGWISKGFIANILGQALPFGLGNWYWNPTRIIPPGPGETGPISEFPLFTFIYADPHAHMFALPLTLLALAWALSVILSHAWENDRSPWTLAWSFLFAGVVIGSLRPVNTWDLPTYLAIGALAAAYAIWRYGPRRKDADGKLHAPWLLALGGVGLLAVLSVVAYQPYAEWYRQGYTSIEPWTGSHTPSGPYLLHWGIFLFFIVTWMAWETRQWLAATPLSSLRKLQPHRVWIVLASVATLSVIVGWLLAGVAIAWLAVPLMLWAGLLLIRPGQDEIKRLVLFLVGTGVFLTLMVEIIVLKGDISRMNTVFKFYMQVWVLLGVSAAMALAWTLSDIKDWLLGWRGAWQLGTALLLACGALFIFLGGRAKIEDRFTTDAPHTLNGMAYMQYAIYYDKDTPLVLAQDYNAIRWMQENVQGSPAIVEAHTGEYKWGSRFSIYTGLPAVLGWNWHQRQQREFVPGNDIWGRVDEIQQFYETEDTALVEDFLRKYQVKYIVLGQLERVYYPGLGLEKFEQYDGDLWQAVYREGDTVIYEVSPDVLAGG